MQRLADAAFLCVESFVTMLDIRNSESVCLKRLESMRIGTLDGGTIIMSDSVVLCSLVCSLWDYGRTTAGSQSRPPPCWIHN